MSAHSAYRTSSETQGQIVGMRESLNGRKDVVSFAAVIRVVVTQRSSTQKWGGALRDDPNNGCEGD